MYQILRRGEAGGRGAKIKRSLGFMGGVKHEFYKLKMILKSSQTRAGLRSRPIPEHKSVTVGATPSGRAYYLVSYKKNNILHDIAAFTDTCSEEEFRKRIPA